ncbi:MAG: aminopeptidase N [Gammaproteobacteria bacterium]|nr:aminopeptidase N [Gammaproteobacteria bacterium]
MTDRKQNSPRLIRRVDYTPPAFLVERVDLRFELDPDETRVSNVLRMARNPAAESRDGPLTLDGQDLTLDGLVLDGEELGAGDFDVVDDTLTIQRVPDRFSLEVSNRISPRANTALEGLYLSNDMLCTQCEAEGFRRITYYPDRPDVMAVFTTTLVADPARFPVLLSNGNRDEAGTLDDGRHWVRWHDPHPKPSYLFALVAGDLRAVTDRFVTRGGRDVKISFYVEPGEEDKCGHAVQSLKEAMAWDETRFGLECDLDDYMVVAVSHFNMGAMENKGLNIFNSKYVLARPDTATDDDYLNIQAVIGHEYFHNWTGNRVTCRDWFQLSLKEGLTVFRDQEFTSDLNSRGVKRIQDVRYLRTAQFAEDAGPMAHPVRPDSYMEINNFYTLTVYEKGAEVIRMLHTLLGEAGFQRGMATYFERHDGQAVTCDDFVAAMEDANGVDLRQFRLWYGQAGTPVVEAEDDFDAGAGVYTLRLRQSCPPTPDQPEKAPQHIPMALGLLDPRGHDLPLVLEDEDPAAAPTERVLELRQESATFRFTGLRERPIPSLLRGFSAPVKLEARQDDAELAFLMAHDSDPFNRWDAGYRLATNGLLAAIAAHTQGIESPPPDALMNAMERVLERALEDPAFTGEVIALPTEGYLSEQVEELDVDAVHGARGRIKATLAEALEAPMLDLYEALAARSSPSRDPEAVGRRRLKNTLLDYLTALPGGTHHDRALAQYQGARDMTDAMGALNALNHTASPQREAAMDDFLARWRGDPLVLDKWFGLQASSTVGDSLARVTALLEHPDFDRRNPNRVRALIGVFCHGNAVGFHRADGAGYRFLAEQIRQLDPRNPQLTARLTTVFRRWRHHEPRRRALMEATLRELAETPALSPDLYEVISRSLA